MDTQSNTNFLRRVFSSGWWFFLPFGIVWWIAEVAKWEQALLTNVISVLLILTSVVAMGWLLFSWKKLSPTTLFFLGSLGLIFTIFGPDMEFPQDNWGFWARFANEPKEGVILGLGESINAAIAMLIPDFHLFSDVWIISVFWSLLICHQLWRFARAVGMDDLWARGAVISVLLFMGTLGLPMIRHVILGVAAMGFLCQIALFTEVIKGVRKERWLRVTVISVVMLGLVFANHLQNGIMGVLGLTAIALWFVIRRFGWLKGGISLVGLALILWVVFDVVFFRGKPDDVVDSLIVEGLWMKEPGVFNILGAEGRVLLPLGVVGIVNLGVALLFLLPRNRVLAWLVLIPALALLYPPFAKLFAFALSTYDSPIVFNRIFFIVPNTFAIFLALNNGSAKFFKLEGNRKASLVLGTVFLFAGVSVFPQKPIFGKLTNWVNNPPENLKLESLEEFGIWIEERNDIEAGDAVLADMATRFYLLNRFGTSGPRNRRWFGGRVTDVWQDLPESAKELDTFLRGKEIQGVALVSKPQAISPRPSLMSRMLNHTDPFLVKHNLTYSPEMIQRMDQLVAEFGWVKMDAPPFYTWYEVRAGKEEAE